jgi:hypothetical protein
LLDRLAPLLQAQNRIAAEVTRTVRECELTQAAETDGLKTMQSWLRGHAHLAPGEAARVVASGRALEQLPAVAAGFADGAFTAGQVGVIAQIDRTLAATAVAAPQATVELAVGHYLAYLNPDGPEPDPTEGRSLTIAEHIDGL